jgi:hypothetical protein
VSVGIAVLTYCEMLDSDRTPGHRLYVAPRLRSRRVSWRGTKCAVKCAVNGLSRAKASRVSCTVDGLTARNVSPSALHLRALEDYGRVFSTDFFEPAREEPNGHANYLS